MSVELMPMLGMSTTRIPASVVACVAEGFEGVDRVGRAGPAYFTVVDEEVAVAGGGAVHHREPVAGSGDCPATLLPWIAGGQKEDPFGTKLDARGLREDQVADVG